ncbi:MAG: ORF6N domain-containing protein, partial [Bacteroidales bacterium]|nr:ORF6N domain-containing protein [Bacteroidales bacterium]
MEDKIIISQKEIENRIFYIRGVQVMLDNDLAEIYRVETRVLNQAVKRNIERFPEDFMFQLTEIEWKNLKSQNVMSSEHGGRRTLPFAFTEQGVSGLSAVLKSEAAAKMHVAIMRTFVQMRKFINENLGLLQRIEDVERKQLQTDKKFEQIFKALENKDIIPTQGIFFDGQIFDAYEFTSKIIRSAQKSIILIDNYINESTFVHLSKKKKGVQVSLLCKNINTQLKLDIQKANEQYGDFEQKTFSKSHERFLIIDNSEVFHLGASLKDLGKKWFAFSKMDKTS